MQDLDRFLQHLNGLGRSAEGRTESLPVSLLLASLILSNKPDEVLELGMGTADLSVGMLHALNMVGSGRLTIVEDWSAWNGREPEGVGDLRVGGHCDRSAYCTGRLHPAGASDGFRSCGLPGRPGRRP
jgi:hypothetical protein